MSHELRVCNVCKKVEMEHYLNYDKTGQYCDACYKIRRAKQEKENGQKDAHKKEVSKMEKFK